MAQGLFIDSQTNYNNYTNSEAWANSKFNMIYNYIYLYHIDKYIIVPSYADALHDQMKVTFQASNPLGRSAPIYSYENSGPREMQFSFKLHRDMMKQINYNNSSVQIAELGDDYVDLMIKYIQAAALPSYKTSTKMINPPMVAVRLGDDIFIKGIVNGTVGVEYGYPILRDGKFAMVTINFTVTEVDPYSAEQVLELGSVRGLNSTLERKILGGKYAAGSVSTTSNNTISGAV